MTRVPHLSPVSSALAVFGVVGFGLAQPAYEWAGQYAHVLRLEWNGALAVVVAVHIVPAALVWVARRLAGGRRAIFDVAVGGLALASVAWQARASLTGRPLLVPDVVSASLALAGLVTAWLLYRVARQATASFVTYAGLLAVVLPALFVWQQSRVATVPTHAASRPDTLLILVLDEFSLEPLLASGGGIDARRFPGFSRLAARSLWFPQAMANYGLTALSIPSMTAGQLVPASDPPAVIAAFARARLFGSLAGAGYRVQYFSTYLGCPSQVATCVNYADPPLRLDLRARLALLSAHTYFAYAQRASELYPSLPAHARRREAELLTRWSGSELAQPGRATLMHLLLTHDPYVLDADGRTVASRDGIFWPGRDLLAVRRRYEAQIQWVDGLIARVLDDLDRREGTRTTLVVTADHGACWTAQCQGRLHVTTVEPSLVLVPMFVSGPGVPPGVAHSDYQHIDFSATVLRAVGLSGGDIIAPAGGQARRRLFFPEANDRQVDVGLPARSVALP